MTETVKEQGVLEELLEKTHVGRYLRTTRQPGYSLLFLLPLIGLLVALFGIFMAYVIYGKQWIKAEMMGRIFGPLYTLVFRKYFFDELYEGVIVKLALIKGLFTGFSLFDSKGVDGAVNGVSDVVMDSGRAIRHAQTGQLQLYGLFIGIGVVVISLCVYFFG